MHPSFYMLEKELIEHKLVTRVPLFILACSFLIFISLIANTHENYQIHINGNIDELSQEWGMNFNHLVKSGAALISLLLTSLYLPKTLRKERQEGSAMFWRSMPVSHLMTHSVKLVFALLVIPVICSMLVLSIDILFWIINTVRFNQLLLPDHSLFNILLNWLSFLLQMAIAAFALLPFACVALAISQVINSPILVMTVIGYTLKLLPIYLFDFYGVSDFFTAILAIPMKVFSPNLLSGFVEAGVVNLLIYYVIGAVALAISLSLSKTNEISISKLFKNH